MKKTTPVPLRYILKHIFLRVSFIKLTRYDKMLLPISFYSSPFLLTNLFFSGVAQITSITPDTLSSAENKLFIPFDTPEAEVITMICMRASLPIELVCEYVCV